MDTAESTDERSLTNTTRPSWVVRLLASRWAPIAAAALCLVLTVPALWNGLDLDDYYHRAVMLGTTRSQGFAGGPQSMFRFARGDVALNRRMLDIGFLPWWTDPRMKAEFLQFLTVQTHVLDYALWPDTPALMHAHSLLWLAGLVFLVGCFYRRILGATWMAGLAGLLFAVEDGHGTPAGWICNRNVLLAATFGVACLIAHDHWRRDRGHGAMWAALGLWACSLCAKEAGIATCAYLGAYAAWLDAGRFRDRLLSLVPYGVVLVAWRIVRDMLGYGVANMGLYMDPITDPSRFLSAAAGRLPVLLLGQWFVPPCDLSFGLIRLLGSPLWWWAVAFTGILSWLLWPLLRRDREARFFATGMVLALIPICATQPMDRLLMFAGLGAFGLMVRFWHFAFGRSGLPPSGRPRHVAAVTLGAAFAGIHLVGAPLALCWRTANPLGPRRLMRSFYIELPADEGIREQDLIVVNPPSVMHADYAILRRELDGLPAPRAVRSLAGGISPLTVTRPDDRSLEIRVKYGFLHLPMDQLFRSECQQLRSGETVVLRGMTAEVKDLTPDGRPALVRFSFDVPLEDESLRWLCWREGAYQTFDPPGIGEQITLASPWPF